MERKEKFSKNSKVPVNYFRVPVQHPMTIVPKCRLMKMNSLVYFVKINLRLDLVFGLIIY